ncbi:PREDICTED: NACHT domain- and WD repeat-containing protein 1-like [Priapulus caudatus]|uniref:NACHT domain- and WD repeat-containing protein 1-like n=1 Tax=Priapulus caudatus TaxID=37621 RepID=A0ABM1E494_PRICU|nr:PREDICTED: NACHT domain- and WD repeat-containing protein 1-like [Priapulus caudatus]
MYCSNVQALAGDAVFPNVFSLSKSETDDDKKHNTATSSGGSAGSHKKKAHGDQPPPEPTSPPPPAASSAQQGSDLDSSVERNHLMKKVYPKLQLYCAERGWELHIVDLHQGLVSELSHVSYMQRCCLDELASCQQHPYIFVLFLNDLYGVTIPPSIEADDFQQMLAAAKDPEQAAILNKWYTADAVVMPATVEINNKERLELKESAILLAALFNAMTAVQRDKYMCSVMEQEVRRGILHDNFDPDTVLWVNRTFSGFPHDVAAHPNCCDYADAAAADGDADVVRFVRDRLSMLKKQVHHRLLMNRSNVLRHQVEWHERHGVCPEKVPEHGAYVEKMCAQFEESAQRVVDKIVRSRQEKEEDKPFKRITDKLHQDLGNSHSYCKSLLESYVEWPAPLQHVENYTKNAHTTQPLVVHGPRGSGKGALLAKVVSRCSQWLSDCICVFRFVKASPGCSLGDTLRSICEQLAIIYGLPRGWQVKEPFGEIMRRLPGDRTLIILVDGIDECRPYDDIRGVDWVPVTLPTNVKVIVTVGDDTSCMAELQNRFSDAACYYQMPPVTQQVAESVFRTVAQACGRTISDKRADETLAAVRACTSPLHVQLLSRLACVSRDDDVARCVGGTLDEQIVKAIDDAGRNAASASLLRHALGYLLLARDGVSHAELLDLLSCDNTALDSVAAAAAADPAVRRFPPLLWARLAAALEPYLLTNVIGGRQLLRLRHRSMADLLRARHAADDVDLNAPLREYFSGRWANGAEKPAAAAGKKKGTGSDRCVAAQPEKFADSVYNSRRLTELPHAAHACASDDASAAEYLFDVNWLLAKLHGCDVHQVIQDVMLAIAKAHGDQDLQLLLEVLRLSSHALENDPSQLFVQLGIRLNKLMSDSADAAYPRMRKLYEAVTAEDRDYFEPSALECLLSPRADTAADDTAAAAAADGKRGVVVSSIYRLKATNKFMVCLLYERGEIHVWDMHACAVVRTLRGLSAPRDTKFIDDLKAVVLCNRELKIYNLDTGEMEVKLKGIMNQKMPFYELHDQNHVVSMSRNRMYIHVIQISTGDTQSTFKAGEDRFLNSLTVSSNGHYLVCGDETQKPTPLLVWDLNNRKLIYDLRINNHEFQTKMLTVSSDGHFVVCACKEVISEDAINNVVIYDLTTGTVFKKWKPGYNTTAIAISSEADWVTTALDNGNILLWDLTTGTCKFTMKGHYSAVDNLIASTDGSRLLSYDSTGFDRSVRLWDLNTGKCLGALTLDDNIVSCQLSPDGSMVALALPGWENVLTLRLRKQPLQPDTESYGSPDRAENVYTVAE